VEIASPDTKTRLHRPLPTPMVHAKAIDVLKQIYHGRLDGDVSGKRSGIPWNPYVSSSRPQKVRRIGTLRENRLDFSYFKNQLLDPETMNSIDLVLLMMAFVALIVALI
jgi:hypothetical protein